MALSTVINMPIISLFPNVPHYARCLFLQTMAHDYKEKHKLDSKLISDSAFRTHLNFCKNRETINLSDLKLKTHTSNTGSWRCYVGGGKRNENRGSIKCGKQKGGKLDGPSQCY